MDNPLQTGEDCVVHLPEVWCVNMLLAPVAFRAEYKGPWEDQSNDSVATLYHFDCGGGVEWLIALEDIAAIHILK